MPAPVSALYIVIERSRSGEDYETDPVSCRKELLSDLREGQWDRPVRIFCDEDGKRKDISKEVASDLLSCGEYLSGPAADFVERVTGRIVPGAIREMA